MKSTQGSAAQAGGEGGVQRAYFAFLREGKFMIQRCEHCARHVFYPRALCPHCGASEPGWVPAQGGGTVYASSVVRKKPEDGGDYNVALVDLDEGVRMMSRIDGIAPDQVQIGMRVVARIVDAADGSMVVFNPQGDAA
ncbi:Zn-ribbon domain-containing OB-fold protein [Candidimonas nitroreducens]|uniref:DNA-binding protein n=1 Tax=Candidimonas nitroreducens TaxID=683354 RepID=A0A225ME36_9BURK|nr:Zn-ribbon domain-containing OB-fold protein [Candidimonas nitroreducens]OWT59052.1 DNA-binding protein [Candidimonas nitroreducens]